MLRSAADRDRGSASLAMVLLAPILVILMFVGFQAAMWNHARTEARLIARETAMLVARDRLPAAQAAVSARTSLAGRSLHNVHVEVSSVDGRVIVTVRGDAPGIIRGTSSGVTVTVALPIEGWVAL